MNGFSLLPDLEWEFRVLGKHTGHNFSSVDVTIFFFSNYFG